MTDQLDFSHKPTLHGDLVDLRPVRASDALILNVELDKIEFACEWARQGRSAAAGAARGVSAAARKIRPPSSM